MKKIIWWVLPLLLFSMSVQADTDYRIGPKDLIEFSVFKLQEMNTQARVSSSGFITLPLLGKLKVEGLTAFELEELVAEKLREKYIKDPQVTVFIKEYISRRAFVIGAVHRPGAYQILGDKNLVQLLAEAGGLTEFVAGDTISVIRGEEKITVDMRDIFDEYKHEANIGIQADDLVIIPQERTKYIYVIGEVKNPGLTGIKKAGNITLLEAIARAGGFTEKAAKSNVIFHRKEKGQIRIFKFDVKDIIYGKNKDFDVREGDIIYVKESIF